MSENSVLDDRSVMMSADPMYTISELKKEIERQHAETSSLRQALVDIENPVAKWKRELKEGEVLDGAMALHMAKDPETYRRMAREALTR